MVRNGKLVLLVRNTKVLPDLGSLKRNHRNRLNHRSIVVASMALTVSVGPLNGFTVVGGASAKGIAPTPWRNGRRLRRKDIHPGGYRPRGHSTKKWARFD